VGAVLASVVRSLGDNIANEHNFATNKYLYGDKKYGCGGNSIMAGAVTISDGSYTGAYPVAVSGGSSSGLVWVNGTTVNVKHNGRAYIAQSCDSSFQSTTFKQFNFVQRTLSFTVSFNCASPRTSINCISLVSFQVDLSQAGCGCNAAFYMTTMAGPGVGQCGDYYCDANDVCGQLCPEMDILEANTHAAQVTPHKCNTPANGVYSSCDSNGCSQNSYNLNPTNFGPGTSYVIDTTYPFQVSSQFLTSNGSVSTIITTFSQSGKLFQFTHSSSDCGSGYLSALTGPLGGMTIVLSYWGDAGSDMSWLDVPPCSASVNCNTNSYVSFSDIKIV
jgi:hypothetical protein